MASVRMAWSTAALAPADRGYTQSPLAGSQVGLSGGQSDACVQRTQVPLVTSHRGRIGSHWASRVHCTQRPLSGSQTRLSPADVHLPELSHSIQKPLAGSHFGVSVGQSPGTLHVRTQILVLGSQISPVAQSTFEPHWMQRWSATSHRGRGSLQ